MRVTPQLVLAIIDRERPNGWGIRYSRKRVPSLSGETHEADDGTRCIRIPAIVAGSDLRHTLFLFFHECYHARTWEHPPVPQHREEYYAERHAINTMHEYGINVRRKDISLAKWRVRQYVIRDEKRGIKIDPHARRWSRP